MDVKQDTERIVLDTRDLSVQSVALNLNGEPKKAGFTLEDNQALGQKLVITTESLKSGDRPVLEIKYESSNNAAALQFLTAEQTTDRVVIFKFKVHFSKIFDNSGSLSILSMPSN